MSSNTSSAYYLKYRPQNLDSLIGQELVKKTLLSAFTNNKLSHAYLFVGPRGTGKTSTARILAKMVNCELVQGSELVVGSEKQKNTTNYELLTTNYPCNKCNACISITDGSFLDLIEIDAASNRGIDDIRTLRERIKLSPSGGKKKVYIIDEVHMLTTEAFNALLKTLEEPPSHALFILATTEGNKVPQTILSRVQRLDFKLASPDELKIALEKICQEEKIEIDQESLLSLVKKADGSYRDGVKYLDQIASSNGKITIKDIEEGLKTSSFDNLADLITTLSDKNAKQSLLKVSGIVSTGVDIKDAIGSLMDIFRNLVLIKNDLGEELVKPSWGEEKYQNLKTLAGKFTMDELINALDKFQQGLERLKTASIVSLPLELAVVEICGSVSRQVSGSASQPLVISKSVDALISRPAEAPIIADISETVVNLPIAESSPIPSEIPMIADSPNEDILKIKDKWTFVLETIRPYNFSLEALLRSVNITECGEKVVVIEVPYSFHQRILEAPKNRDILESILSEILGRTIRISTVLGQRPARREDIANIEVAADDEIIKVASEIFNSESIN